MLKAELLDLVTEAVSFLSLLSVGQGLQSRLALLQSALNENELKYSPQIPKCLFWGRVLHCVSLLVRWQPIREEGSA